jgi:hypothetical protein
LQKVFSFLSNTGEWAHREGCSLRRLTCNLGRAVYLPEGYSSAWGYTAHGYTDWGWGLCTQQKSAQAPGSKLFEASNSLWSQRRELLKWTQLQCQQHFPGHPTLAWPALWCICMWLNINKGTVHQEGLYVLNIDVSNFIKQTYRHRQGEIWW